MIDSERLYVEAIGWQSGPERFKWTRDEFRGGWWRGSGRSGMREEKGEGLDLLSAKNERCSLLGEGFELVSCTDGSGLGRALDVSEGRRREQEERQVCSSAVMQKEGLRTK